jgi:hypothetical protein
LALLSKTDRRETKMKNLRFGVYLLLAFFVFGFFGLPMRSQYMTAQQQEPALIVGRNVNMVSGTSPIDGDPYLQRQNEPSIAVSTRNSLHLLAGANDYRLVDVPQSEGPLPGVPEGAAAGDAWLGLYWSLNGGESWKSTLLPGHLFDNSAIGVNSPLFGLGAASDPTVRAGANGMFYYSGIAFDRVEHGRSVIFVSRLIDNNITEIGDPIEYLDTTLIDEGTSGQFADKPWIAVDMPRYGGDSVPVHPQSTGVQRVARHNVYIVYSVFLGNPGGSDQSQIMFARSTDCGRTWERPIKLSESQHLNQGTTIAISPLDGRIIIVWRRYASTSETHAIMACVSTNFGRSFSKPAEIESINPFDQFTGTNRFRTTAFPALAVDHNGIAYVAWSQRGVGPNGEARIVIKASKDGEHWSATVPVDDHPAGGHQLMPSLTYAGGRLVMTWYDTRKSLGYVDHDGTYHHAAEIADPGPTGKRHTLDAWVAQAYPSNPGSNPPASPSFMDSTQASRYLYQAKTQEPEGWLLDEDDNPVHVSGKPPVIYQAQFSFPNFPIFMGGAAPFMGDYIDITPAPAFLYDDQSGRWRFNTGMEAYDPAVYHLAFACNRDVVPPRQGFNWMSYWPPGPGCLDDYTAGMRNQNIYTAPVSQGILVGSPVNTKRLATYRRSFPIFVKNLMDQDKLIRLTISAPGDMESSFWEFDPPAAEWPFQRCEERVVELYVLAHSSVALTVFVQPYGNDLQTFRVNVQELDGAGNPTGLTNSVVLNPDPVNTQLVPADKQEEHTPFLLGEYTEPVELSDPTMLSAQVVYAGPYLDELLNYANPDIAAPGLRHPGLRHDTLINPGLRHTAIGNIPEGEVTDIQWKVKNGGNTTSAYSFEPIGEIPPVPYQLLIYRVAGTPTSDGCQLTEEEHHELLLALENPSLLDPGLRHPGLRHPGLRHNTFFLAPGEEAVVTLRLIDTEPSSGGGEGNLRMRPLGSARTMTLFSPEDYAKSVAGAAIPQATNPDGTINFMVSLYILDASDPDDPFPVDRDLPPAVVNDAYSFQLQAYGGTPTFIDDSGTYDDPDDDIWKYDGHWTAQSLLYPAGQLSGLSVDGNGQIFGSPIYYSELTYPQILSFVAEVTDTSDPPQLAQREFRIHIDSDVHPIAVKAGPGGQICPVGLDCISGEGSVDVPNGENQTFIIQPDDCHHAEVTVMDDGMTLNLGSVETYTFENVRRDDNEIQASFLLNTYTIAATVTAGGTITPSGDVPVLCRENKAFTLSAEEGYLLEDVLADGVSQGPVTSYTFYQVVSNHTIHGVFKKLEAWVVRYNNSLVNGDDESSSLGADASGNVYVTGRSQGDATGFDYFTLKYDGLGNTAWGMRYNNSEVNGDDEASSLGLDGAGNVYVTGYSIGRTTGPDCFTLSYDADGLPGWSARFDGPAHEGDKGNVLIVDPASSIYVAGYSIRGMPKKHSDYVTLKYDSSGGLKWDAQYDDRRNGTDEVTAIEVDGKGSVYITGRSEDSLRKKDVMHFDYYTVKYDANTGGVAWEARYDNAPLFGADEPAGIAVDAQGNVYVTGRSQSATGFDAVTVKYDPAGKRLWVHRYDYAAGDDEASAIAVDAQGNVYVTGRSQGDDTGFDYVTIKYASDVPDGQPEWIVRYNNDDANGADEAIGVVADAQGNAYVTGRSQSATGFDYFTIKYDSSGATVWRVRYNHPDRNGDDEPRAIVIAPNGNVFVTGRSQGVGSGFDYATVKYEQPGS